MYLYCALISVQILEKQYSKKTQFIIREEIGLMSIKKQQLILHNELFTIMILGE